MRAARNRSFRAGTDGGKENCIDRAFRARPSEFIAQESSMPLLRPHCYAGIAWKRDRSYCGRLELPNLSGQYSMLPGGLTRVMAAPNTGGPGLMHHADGSKDTWVFGESHHPGKRLPGGVAEQAVVINRGSTDLPSRVADDLFWMGRYAERAEGDGADGARCSGTAWHGSYAIRQRLD